MYTLKLSLTNHTARRQAYEDKVLKVFKHFDLMYYLYSFLLIKGQQK